MKPGGHGWRSTVQQGMWIETFSSVSPKQHKGQIMDILNRNSGRRKKGVLGKGKARE